MTMLLRDIFAKPVERPIEGVIKADDKASLRVELEEYVITSEIGQRLEEFLTAYNSTGTSNGVWISGFFGSGKSHILKMLALLLENSEIDGVRAFDIFESKLKEDPMLAGGLRKAVSIPSKSILFNIDQKADVIAKTDVDALLSVFQKVFDEMCGYYGKQPHVAQFERDLDSRGQLEGFRRAFQDVAGKSWERGREQALLERRNIAAAFAAVTGGDAADAKDILSQYRDDTRVSIEDFANTVSAWIKAQDPNFRLNFFVDEVGQYIADNVKLMTNLQTIAESLNTKCRGQAWIIVTAQQDMASVIGDMTAQQENDFSKIQARFANRMPLNSQDVAEVIQRRLLAKTEAGQITLGNIHDREENNLRTLFDFGDGSFRFKNFNGRDHFIASYPFPNYQYDLFQRAIMGLSQHNAFEGKHSSVGERSMLGVFQEVAKKLAENPVGGLATFDLMFEGIRTALKSSVQQSIQLAEKNFVDEFAVRVLKALFLVKYVKEFKPTVRNIAILLLSEFEADQTEQRHKIEEALSLLERQTLIQRNGEVYEFLTNEEKDVEDEIKALSVDPSELAKEMETLVFDTVLRGSNMRGSKVRHLDTGHEYPFARKLDDHLLGRDQDLAINVITPFGDNADSPDAVRMNTMGREELAVLLGPDLRFIRDLTLWKKTDKFIRQASNASQQSGRDRIVGEKREQSSRRYKDLELRLRKLVAEARLFVRGVELEINGEDPQERLTKAFQTVIEKVYTNLPMLRGVSYSEADLGKACRAESGLFGAEGSGLTEAEQEVSSHIQSQDRRGMKVSVKSVTERFGANPYGWPDMAALCIVGSLVARGQLEARSDGTPLEGDQLAHILANTRLLSNVLLAPQVEVTAAQLRKAKELFKELFDMPANGSDARSLGAEWSEGIGKLSAELEGYQSRMADYLFLAELDPFRERIAAMRDQAAAWFITGPVQQEDDLLDAKEEVLDKIRSFMNGPQRAIYDDVRAFLRAQEANLGYVDPEAAKAMQDALADRTIFKGSRIQELKAGFFAFKERTEQMILAERTAVGAAIDDVAAKVVQTTEFDALAPDQQAEVRRDLESQKDGLEGQQVIAVLRDRANRAQTELLPRMLERIVALQAPKEPVPQPGSPGAETPHPLPDTPPAPTPTFVKARAIDVAFSKTYLEDEGDVDRYLQELKRLLLAEISNGSKVIV